MAGPVEADQSGARAGERGKAMEQVLQAVRAAFEGHPGAARFLADWPEPVVSRHLEPRQLPVCRWLDAMGEGGLVTLLREAAPGLTWRQTYGAADFGAAFLEGYGWSEFIGQRGPVASERIACGVLLLGPHVTYPSHAHEAEEIYLPIAGLAEWQRGAAPFAPVPVGQAIHHPAWMPHAMRTGGQPLAALYLWRGGDLAAKSVILGLGGREQP